MYHSIRNDSGNKPAEVSLSGGQTISIRTIADGLGALGSVTCALHCLAGPVALVLGTSLPAALGDESVHRLMLWLVIPAALAAFALGCFRHKDKRTLCLALAGMTGLILTVFLPERWAVAQAERWITLAASGILVTAHVRNYRLCRTRHCRHQE